MSNYVIPPLLTTRDAATGLLNNVVYAFNEDGTVNWRKMVKPEYLAVNEQRFHQRNEQVPESIEGVADSDLIILLPGLKELARLRGYSSLSTNPSVACPEYVLMVCKIDWLPHRETNGQAVSSTGAAMATLQNTEGFTKTYLAEMAENRALARCIRTFLGIHIVSREEMGTATITEEVPKKTNPGDPCALLQAAMDEKNITFTYIKERLVESKFKGAEELTSINDIPKFKVMALIKKVKSLPAVTK